MFEHTYGDSWLRSWVFKVQDKDPSTGVPLFDENSEPVMTPLDITGSIVKLHLRAQDNSTIIKAIVCNPVLPDKYLILPCPCRIVELPK